MKSIIVSLLLTLSFSLSARVDSSCFYKAKNSYIKWTERNTSEFDDFEYKGRLGQYLEQLEDEDQGYIDLEDIQKTLGRLPMNSHVFIGYSSAWGGSGANAVVYSSRGCKFLDFTTVFTD